MAACTRSARPPPINWHPRKPELVARGRRVLESEAVGRWAGWCARAGPCPLFPHTPDLGSGSTGSPHGKTAWGRSLGTSHSCQSTKYQVLDTKFQLPNSKYQVPNTKNQIPNTMYKTKYQKLSTKYPIQNTKYQTPDTKYQISGTKSMIPSTKRAKKYQMSDIKYQAASPNSKYQAHGKTARGRSVGSSHSCLSPLPHSQPRQLKAGKSHWSYAKLRAINTDRCD